MVALLIAALLAAAGGSAPESAAETWTEVSVGKSFTLRAPDGSRLRPGHGTDSLTGTIEVPGFELAFDYGLYSNSLADVGETPGYRAQQIRVDQQDAKLVTFEVSEGGGRFVGIHFPRVRQSTLGSLRLSVTCTVANDADVQLIERIYRSIRFPAP